MNTLRPRVVAEISIEAIKHNYTQIRSIIPKHTEIMGIIKADGYGHGAIEVAKILQEQGVNRFAVAIAKEGEELRKEGITSPILVLGYTPKADIKTLIENDLTQTVFSLEMAGYISDEAKKLNKTVNIHLKVDTGMGRIGFLSSSQSIEEVKKIAELPHINMEGIFTHFSTADEEDITYTKNQWSIFEGFLKELNEVGIDLPVIHAANSAATMCHPYTHLNMVRPGIILYGYYPSSYLQNKILDLRPAMTLKSQVVHVKELPEGHYVGYGRKFYTKQKTKIATIPIGYADGYSRRLAGKGKVLIHGQFAPIVGNICMDQFMVDVTHIKGVKVEDEVVIFGKQGDKTIPIEELAIALETINYEIMCMIGKRVPRLYV
ncbi:alanine racemase [Sporanaerobium hydrogeniformans]|uniref:Alanine racemase n=1 Tax=Sporanaerobium hydrogeniformans TaxID=3072179 RepID=A0AC61DB38_9FIRM|nr:alanine racemase [Sporanaerobium hydrogeniformans]PHV69817.1 alanine racemase [Sporanaerobium hydrogeniformans]